VFTRGERVLRQVNHSFAAEYEVVSSSGLHDELISDGLLIAHRLAPIEDRFSADAGTVLEVVRIPFLSYPYEWSFGQLRDAALLTLDIQLRAIARGFTLRDASAYNVQFLNGKPIFIDTLSLGRRTPGAPWAAYRQFCEHFLVPLALMSRVDIRCGQLMRTFMEGVPLDLGARLLPLSSRFDPRLLFHIVLHARSVRAFANSSVASVAGGATMSTRAMGALVEGLRRAVESLQWAPPGTEWADYVDNTNYSADAVESKRAIVRAALTRLAPRTVWDLGSNTGEFSREASRTATVVISFDVDPAAVERNYRQVRADDDQRVLPLLLDLRNPTSASGWGADERESLLDRGPADTILALALLHHLTIGSNIPLDRVASFLARAGRSLIIEFVPKSDSQVQRLLRNRPDTFPSYTQDEFERCFALHFATDRRERIAGSERLIYTMTSRRTP
jgi:ribosomal protein L11 methylase PrmA